MVSQVSLPSQIRPQYEKKKSTTFVLTIEQVNPPPRPPLSPRLQLVVTPHQSAGLLSYLPFLAVEEHVRRAESRAPPYRGLLAVDYLQIYFYVLVVKIRDYF